MQQVEIRVRGHLDENLSKWLDGFDLRHTEPDETVLTGPVVDQAALYGLLSRLRDLGLPLVSVNPVEVSDQEVATP